LACVLGLQLGFVSRFVLGSELVSLLEFGSVFQLASVLGFPSGFGWEFE
jgi:hypothetical protein